MKNTAITIALLFTSVSHAARFVVESQGTLTVRAKVEKFYPTDNPAFSKLRIVTGDVTREELLALPGVSSVEPVFEITKMTILPPENPERLVADELFPYQWGLVNQGQTFIREKDDIHNLPMHGRAGSDVGWRSMQQILRTGGRTVVAVLDSGVDLNHPDLKENLWRNEGECGKDPSVDNDGNKLAGDCAGWNFTEDIESSAAKDPSDLDGHGTHVAGIIGAALNGQGISGVAPNALIMPVKVMKDSGSESKVASSDAFARGIIYAAENGAKVINMSLGWPRALETKYLRDAVFYAISQGVIIVAAAGNNNSSEPLFPCAYDGVICVAASTLDGTFANFSNFGGHIDTVAPGEGILSTNPINYEPEFFFVPGYEIKSGTSQSAPFVAGLVASLISQKGDLSVTEIFGRLYQDPSKLAGPKYVIGGNSTWDSISADITGPVIVPVFKRFRQIVLKPESQVVSFQVPVRNYGKISDSFKISVRALAPHVEVISEDIEDRNFSPGELRDFNFDLSIKDSSAESNVTFEVTVVTGSLVRKYLNEVSLVRDIRLDPRFSRHDVEFVGGKLPLGGVREGAITSFLFTLPSYGTDLKHELFLRRYLREENKLEVTIFRRKAGKLLQAPKLITIPNATVLVNLFRLDVNRDGSDDYVVQTLNEVGTEKFFEFAFYDSKLDPVWPGFQHVRVHIDSYLASMNDISFIDYVDPQMGKMLLPAFLTVGQLPKVDQPLGSNFDRFDLGRRQRLFYLRPSEGKFEVRALTTNNWEKTLLKDLSRKWDDTVEAESILPVTNTDLAGGALRLLVSVGKGTKRDLYIFSLTALTQRRGERLPQLVLQTEGIRPVLEVSDKGLTHVGESYFNVYDRTRSKMVFTEGFEQRGEFVYKHTAETDHLVGQLTSFLTGAKRTTILQTRDDLVSITHDRGETKLSARPKLRYSFLSHKFLTAMYLPVIYSREGRLSPALYVDASPVTGNRVYLFEEQNGKLVSSIQNSLIVPNNCKALNPNFSSDKGSHEFVFLCAEEGEWVLRTLGM